MNLDLFSIPSAGNNASLTGKRGGPPPLREAGGQEGAAALGDLPAQYAAPGGSATIYQLVREWTTPRWLCDEHVAARRTNRETVVRQSWQPPYGLDCDDCERDRQGAPGYVTPSVAFVATRMGARI